MDIDEALRQAESEEVFLVASDWFDNPSAGELKEKCHQFEQEFERLMPEIVARLGQPDFTEQTAPELRDELYCEALRLAGWKRANGYMLLCLGQHDQETPVFVSLGFRSLYRRSIDACPGD